MTNGMIGEPASDRAAPGPGDVHIWRGRPAPTRVARSVLAGYLGIAPNKLPFTTGKFGKPEIAGRPIRFSKATTRDMTIVAVTKNSDIGVDIEHVRPIVDVLGLAAKAFGAEAAIALGVLPRARRDRAFLQAWTRLEAAIKANGGSLGRDAGHYRIVWSADCEPAILSINGDSQSASRFDMRDLDLGPDYVGAIAVLGRIDRVLQFKHAPSSAKARLTAQSHLAPNAPAA